MSSLEQQLDHAFSTYRAVLQELDQALTAVQTQGLDALEDILPRLDACQQQITSGGRILFEIGTTAALPEIYAAEPRLKERATAVRRLVSEVLAKSQALESQIRTPLRAVTDELIQINRSRLYLKSLKDSCESTSHHMHLQA